MTTKTVISLVLAGMGAVLGGAVALSGAGCGKDCADVGCGPGLEVVLDPPLAWDGPYVIEISLDGEMSHRCDVTTAADAGAGSVSCVGLADIQIYFDLGTDGVTGFNVQAEPAQVTVKVLRGSTGVRERTFSPAYGAPYYPNGEECDPECRFAREVVP